MKYYTVREFAENLRVSEGLIYDKIKNGEINKIPNFGKVIRIPTSELRKIKQSQTFVKFTKQPSYFMYNPETVEVIETTSGRIRKIKFKQEYVARDIANSIGLAKTATMTERVSNTNCRIINREEMQEFGFKICSKGLNLITYDGVVEYLQKSTLSIDVVNFLKEINVKNEYFQEEFKAIENPNNLSKIFEGHQVEIIEVNGGLLFELYSTGMALGQVKNAKGKDYPNKDRIDKNIENAEIEPVVRNAQLYLTEPQLYDLMLEMKTDKVKPFRKWVTNEVLPTIRKAGGYVDNSVKFVDNYFSNLSEDVRQAIRNELNNKNQILSAEIKPLEDELKANLKVIGLIDEIKEA